MSYEQRDENTFRKHGQFLNKMLFTKSEAVFRLQFPVKNMCVYLGRKIVLWYIVVSTSFITALIMTLRKVEILRDNFR